jgi:hypothetical protein
MASLNLNQRTSGDTQFGIDHPRGDPRPPSKWRAFRPHRECVSWLPISEVSGSKDNETCGAEEAKTQIAVGNQYPRYCQASSEL